MKRLLVLFFTTLITVIIWLNVDFDPIDETEFMPQKVLELSVPIDVTIDLDLINSLAPAYER